MSLLKMATFMGVIRWCLITIFFTTSVLSDNCKISWMETGHEVSESQYTLELSIVNTTGNLVTYFPRTYYDITIKSKLRNHTFTQFYFMITNTNKTMSYGTLELRESELSMFHNGQYCINRVKDGPVSLAKLSLKIGWQSPPAGSGCISFKAAVKETELRYHVANVTVCQDPRYDLDHPGEVLRNCCACDEAKYELEFEGLWSRYTHPKHFPPREWLAVFPTVIGASHSPDYEFWHPYIPASEGLAKFTQTGFSTKLEEEIKMNRLYVSTLIKFRGANFQNKTGRAYAGVRVTKAKHVVSLVATIDPSPDWFIGVTSLELCQSDCTWIESKTLNLYAYDAGVRNGMLYEDLDEFTNPPDVIQSLNMTWPPPKGDLESPFYDQTNNTHDVRPLARIHLRRLRGSEKSCQRVVEANENCVGPWSKWSECTSNCSIGIRTRTRNVRREYKDKSCTAPLSESTICQAAHDCEKELTRDDCRLTEWSEWTRCSRICGLEVIKRSRSYRWRDNDQRCEARFGEVPLVEKRDCGNPPCPEEYPNCVDERYSSWMDWSPCSVTQGSGFSFRYRTIKEYKRREKLNATDGDKDYGYSTCMYQHKVCEVNSLIDNSKKLPPPLEEEDVPPAPNPPIETDDDSKNKIPEFCLQPVDRGNCDDNQDSHSHRFYYNESEGKCLTFDYSGCGGNENNFNDNRACIKACVIHGRKIDCVMEKWSRWSECNCASGIRTRKRLIKIHPKNMGRQCPVTKTNIGSCTCNPLNDKRDY